MKKLKEIVATFSSGIVMAVTFVSMQLVGLLIAPKRFFGAGPIN